jgi:hypothetical protein
MIPCRKVECDLLLGPRFRQRETDLGSQRMKVLMRLLRKVLGRTLVWARGLYRSEEVFHVEREVSYSVVVCDSGHRAEVDTLLVGVCRDVRPDLLEEVENVSTTQVCRCGPFFSPRTSQEKTSKEVEMNTISAEAKTRLRLGILHCQINVPAGLPQLERLHCRSK